MGTNTALGGFDSVLAFREDSINFLLSDLFTPTDADNPSILPQKWNNLFDGTDYFRNLSDTEFKKRISEKQYKYAFQSPIMVSDLASDPEKYMFQVREDSTTEVNFFIRFKCMGEDCGYFYVPTASPEDMFNWTCSIKVNIQKTWHDGDSIQWATPQAKSRFQSITNELGIGANEFSVAAVFLDLTTGVDSSGMPILNPESNIPLTGDDRESFLKLLGNYLLHFQGNPQSGQVLIGYGVTLKNGQSGNNSALFQPTYLTHSTSWDSDSEKRSLNYLMMVGGRTPPTDGSLSGSLLQNLESGSDGIYTIDMESFSEAYLIGKVMPYLQETANNYVKSFADNFEPKNIKFGGPPLWMHPDCNDPSYSVLTTRSGFKPISYDGVSTLEELLKTKYTTGSVGEIKNLVYFQKDSYVPIVRTTLMKINYILSSKVELTRSDDNRFQIKQTLRIFGFGDITYFFEGIPYMGFLYLCPSPVINFLGKRQQNIEAMVNFVPLSSGAIQIQPDSQDGVVYDFFWFYLMAPFIPTSWAEVLALIMGELMFGLYGMLIYDFGHLLNGGPYNDFNGFSPVSQEMKEGLKSLATQVIFPAFQSFDFKDIDFNQDEGRIDFQASYVDKGDSGELEGE